MARKLKDERSYLEDYLKSSSGEDARRPLLYPVFQNKFKDAFKIESDACGADVYIEGKLLVESKSNHSQWLDGFYQALHYHKKYGLAYHTIMVIAHEFCAVWKLNNLPETAVIFSKTSDPNKAPNVIGKENARRTAAGLKTEIKEAALYWLDPKDLESDFFSGGKSVMMESYEIIKILNNLDSDRQQINKHNFIQAIERIKTWFPTPIEAVHAFYTAVPYWDITSTAAINNDDEIRIIGFHGQRFSDAIKILPRHILDFKKYIETQYVFTNEGSGLTVDYYFGRFDEVLAAIDEEYVKQHGIFFTDANLSRFALWFAEKHFPGNIQEDYVVFDPAGGSGNLVSSWRGKLKHKIVSELQPDLLRIIERRMKADPFHIETGFTIIPKTSKGDGLNFLDKNASEYMQILLGELKEKNLDLNKPLAFLLNPPYKNTDENEDVRLDKNAEYHIDNSILEIAGPDASKERYLAFLGQILKMSVWQNEKYTGRNPIVLVFTPTSWLMPRPTYVPFRKSWDKIFRYHSGFIVTSNEFFKLKGKWPLAFTIWQYDPDVNRVNTIHAEDLTELTHEHLDSINWFAEKESIEGQLAEILQKSQSIKLDNSRGDIRTLLPYVETDKGVNKRQTRFDFSHAKDSKFGNQIVSGFPVSDTERHFKLKRICGNPSGEFIGFMDDQTPVRLRQEPSIRLSNLPDRVWFRLDPDFTGLNKSKCFNGPTDNRAYCAYDLESAFITFTWFSITKALNGQYPVWANQYDIWPPEIPDDKKSEWQDLIFAFVLGENRCVVTKFEADNPVPGAPEVFVDNPLCPANPESFWSTILRPAISGISKEAAYLIDAVNELYRLWNHEYCKGQWLKHVGLQDEPYFKYFNYADFLTPYSGLVQLRKYNELHPSPELGSKIEAVWEASKTVRQRIYEMLVQDFGYFE